MSQLLAQLEVTPQGEVDYADWWVACFVTLLPVQHACKIAVLPGAANVTERSCPHRRIAALIDWKDVQVRVLRLQIPPIVANEVIVRGARPAAMQL